jgi:hypothetical protein
MLIGKALLVQAWTDPEGYQEVEASRFQDNQHIRVVRCSALRTGRLYHPGNIPGIYLCQRLSRTQCHSVARRIMSKENTNDLNVLGLKGNSSVYVEQTYKHFQVQKYDLSVKQREGADRYHCEHICHFLHKGSAELQKHFLS